MTTRRARALAEVWAERRPDQQTPVFYVRQDLRAPRVMLRRGQLWEYQDRATIRMWGQSFGVPDDGRPWNELPHVVTLLCPTPEVANDVVARSLTLEQAQVHVERWLEEHAHEC